MKNYFFGKNPSVTCPVRIEIFENRKMVFNGRFEIKEYSGNRLVIDGNNNLYEIEGSDIEIGEFTDDFIEISGIFTAVKFT